MRGSVLVVDSFTSHGSTPVTADLARRLSEAGWRVRSVSSRDGRFHRLLDMTTTAWTRRHDYDVANIAVYSGPAFAWAEAVCETLRFAAKPFVLTLHGGNLPSFAAEWPRRVPALLNKASAVTAPSAYLLERMRRWRRDLRLIPNSLDLSEYPYRHRRSLSPRLIWVRAFHALYNPAMAVGAVRLLESQYPQLRLTMIGPDKGDGSLEQARQTSASLTAPSRVTFAGRVSKGSIPNRLAPEDIFINTAHVDNTPVSVLEAMACGLCVVSTNAGGIPHLLRDGFNALLVAPGDAAGMAHAIRRLLTDSKLASTISENARRTVEPFDWTITLPQWDELLSSVAKGHLT